MILYATWLYLFLLGVRLALFVIAFFAVSLSKILQIYTIFTYKYFITYPPKPYVFVPLPLKSNSFNWNNIMKHITLPKVFTALSILILIYLLRSFISLELFKFNFILLEDINLSLEIPKYLFIGFLTILPRLFFLGFWEEIIKLFSPLPMEAGEDPNSQSQSNNEESTNQERGGKNVNRKYKPLTEEEIQEKVHNKVLLSILGEHVLKDTNEVIFAMSKWADLLKKYNDTLPLDKTELEGNEDIMIKLLQFQSNTYTQFVSNRMSWLFARSENMLPNNREKIVELRQKMMEIQTDYRSKIPTMENLSNKTKKVKELYANLNEYRNKVSKELNQAETIGLEDLRKSDLIKEPGIKKAINVEYIEAKKKYNHEDNYLKKRIGQIINTQK